VLGITGTELNLFLARECGRVSAGSAACYAGRLKSLLRLLLLLARLGLRAVEVSGLELRDLDWSTSQISVDGKGHRRDRPPLPADVGEALRPTSTVSSAARTATAAPHTVSPVCPRPSA
jgi:site-specific recombinase XerC